MHPIIWSHFRSIQRAWVLRTPYGNRKRISRGQYNTAQGWIYAQGNLCQRLGPGVRLCIHRFQCIFGKWIFFFPRTVHHTVYAHSLFLVVCFWVCLTLILPICIRVTLRALGQIYHWHIASDTILKNTGEITTSKSFQQTVVHEVSLCALLVL